MGQTSNSPKTFLATEVLEADRRVKLSSAAGYVEYADQADSSGWIGITIGKADAINDTVAVELKDAAKTQRAVAADSFAYGAVLYAANDGKVSDSASGNAIGTALEAATAPGDIVEVLYDKGAASIIMGSSVPDSMMYVSPDGSDTAGNGSMIGPYATITKALSVVTASRKTIMVFPGEYVETLALVWPNVTGVSINGFGGDVTIVGTSGQTEVVLINPTFSASTFEATLSNLTISAPDGVKGIVFNNQNTTGRKFNLYLHNVGIDADTDTDQSLDVVHTTTTQAMRVYCDGQRNIIEGLVYIAPQNADDRFTFTNMQFDGGIQFGTATIASVSTFKNCIMKDAGGSGGQDTQILNVLNCHSLTGTTYAIAALNDFAANAAEVILPAA